MRDARPGRFAFGTVDLYRGTGNGDGDSMNVMAGAVWADYLPPRCDTCKPGPDGSMTGVGWSLVGVGAVVMLLGICGLVFAARSAAGSHADDDLPVDTDADTVADAVGAAVAGDDARAAAESEPEPVMDAVQREDLERRGLLEPQPESEPESEPERSEKSDTAWGTGLVGVGAVAAVFGLIILAFSNSRVEDDKSQLRLAATDLVSAAFDGPSSCRQLAVIESKAWSSPSPSASASTAFLPDPAHCDSSPRQYAEQGASVPAGVFLPIKYVFSSSFMANGEVTLHDTQDNRSMCVTLPDADVAAAAQPSPGTDTDSLPEFDHVTVDPSPYVRDGACPDAPVSSPNSP